MESMFVWTFDGVMQALILSVIMFFIFVMFIFAGIEKIRSWFKKGR
jgi:hypothetical protein